MEVCSNRNNFTLLAPEVVHLSIAPSRTYLTTRRFLEVIELIYETLIKVVLTDDTDGYRGD